MSMKKHGWLSVLASFILIVRCVCSASAVEQLPEEIRNVLSGAEITHSAFWDGPGSTWFVVIRTSDQTNTLVCFEQHDNRWIQRFHTNTAVPQGNVGVKLIHITDKVEDFVYNRTWPGPVLMILMDDGSYTSYQRSDSGQWNLFKVFYQNEQVYLDFEDESIIYRTPIDQDHSKFETVYGSFERDLRKTDLNSIPRTPVQAQKMFEEMRNSAIEKNGDTTVKINDVVYYNTKKAIPVEPDEHAIVNEELPLDGSLTDEKITAYAFINEAQSGDILVCLIDGEWYQFIATERAGQP